MRNENGRADTLRALQIKLGYTFGDEALLDEALTHSSYANENGTQYNERLEFLGDAVLELVTSNRLYRAFPDYDEGKLTRLRAQLVCKESLSRWAKELQLRALIRVGKSLIKSGPTESVAADCVEAVFGAIFLDGGFTAASAAVSRFLDTKPELSGAEVKKDPKTVLQEYYQQHGAETPHYYMAERSGPEHASRFRVQLLAGGKVLAEEWGNSIQEAEFKAAESVLERRLHIHSAK